MKGFRAAALGISWIAGTAVGLPSLAEGMVGSNLSPTGVAAQLRALGCSPSPAAPATLEAVRAAIRGCLADPALSNANRTQLTALERDLIKAFPSGGGAGSDVGWKRQDADGALTCTQLCCTAKTYRISVVKKLLTP